MRLLGCSRLIATSLATGVLALSGCGLSPTAPSASTFSAPATIKGNVHGGQQPIFNSTVRLYATGTSGYGAGSTLLATSAVTDAGGNFSFTKQGTNGGVIGGGATATWRCPTVGNPQIYITAVGGNTQGTTSTSTNNTAAALMAAIGPCNSVSSTTVVSLNEISTVASVFALAQYMNPGTTAGTETVGTSGTTQGTVGINNAVASMQNMVNISSGLTVTPPQYAGTGTAAGVTVTATAESAKITTIANILAACVNTPASSSTQCADLFANALPPVSATSTSLGTLLTAPAVDTLQAAYYMATNPASLGTFTTCTGGSTTTMACLFNLASATSPFQTGLAAQPSDWTIGVTYSAAGTCTNGVALLNGPNKIAIDVIGNIWFINGNAAANNFGELSPTGTPLYCTGNSTIGRGLTIDPTGNVWASFNNALAGSIQEVTSTGTLVSYSPTITPYSLTSDGFGNIFTTTTASGGGVSEIVSPGTSTTGSFVSVVSALQGTGGNNVQTIAPDSAGRLFLTTNSNASMYTVYPAAPAAVTSLSVASNVLTVTVANSFTVGSKVAVYGLTSTLGVALNHTVLTVTGATGTNFTAAYTFADTAATTEGATALAFVTGTASSYSKTTTTLSQASYGVALDNSDNAFTGATCCGTSPGTGYRGFNKVAYNTSTNVGTNTASAQYLVGINGGRSIAVDGGGNEWAGYELPVNAAGQYAVGEFVTSGTTYIPLSAQTLTAPTACATTGCATNGGFAKAGLLESFDLQIDPSGSVWVAGTGTGSTVTYTGTSITQIVGAAVPLATPLSVAAANGQTGAKP